MFEVRPCADQDEYGRAIGAIGQYFTRRPRRSASSAGCARSRTSGCTPPSTDGQIVGGAGAFPFELSVPGGSLPVRGRDRRRRPADASPPRRPPLDDGRAAARRPRARRADRGALGVRGDDLRPLRLRPRLLGGRADGPARVGRVREPARARRDDALRHARGGARAVPARVRRGAARASGHDVAECRVVGGTPPAPGGGREGRARAGSSCSRLDGEPQAYAIYRTHFAFEGGLPASRLIVREALGATPQATAAIWRFLLDVDWMAPGRGLACCRRTIRSSCCSPCPRRARYRMGDALWVRLVDVRRRAVGPRVRRGRAARARGARRRLRRGTTDAGGSRTARCERTEEEPDLALDVAALGSAYLGAVLVHAAARGAARRGVAGRRNRTGGRAVRLATAALVPRDLLKIRPFGRVRTLT